MPSANDPVVHLYGDRLGNGPTERTTQSRRQAFDSGSGNGHEVKVNVTTEVHNHVKHSGATTVHHRDDFLNRPVTNNDNRSYSTTNNHSTTNTTAGQDHSAVIDDLKDRVDRLYRAEEDGYMAGQQAGRSARIEMPGTVLPNASTEHPSVSDNEPQQIENRNPNLNQLQFNSLDPDEQYRM